MKKYLCLVICLFSTGTIYSQHKGGIVSENKIFSSILGVEKEYSVYVPPGYEDSHESYPVLYLLHGAWGSHTDWVRHGNVAFLADKAVQAGTAIPMIIVMPDARGKKANFGGRHMGYFNYPDWRYHDFFIEELIPAIEKKYRVKGGKENRAIAGLSMGADGSVYLAQNFPDYFSSACALSGGMIALDAVPTEDVNSLFFNQMEAVNPIRLLQSADDGQLEKLRSVRWYVDCGDDDYLVKGSIAFYLAMKEKGVPLQFRIRDGGHTWDYWQTGLTDILPYISIGFSK